MVSKKRNNFFHVGEALRSLLTGSKIVYSNPSLGQFKEFINQKEVNYRSKVIELVVSHKGKDEVLNFDQILVQQSIEEALEISNQYCTVQLRNVVYIHNQLVSYGEKIYVRGFESDNVLDGGGHDHGAAEQK